MVELITFAQIHDSQYLEKCRNRYCQSIVLFFTGLICPRRRNRGPYCPATFETGVGLSNHVRGHLHRAGLSHEARHVVSPEQIATSDKMQHLKNWHRNTCEAKVRKCKFSRG